MLSQSSRLTSQRRFPLQSSRGVGLPVLSLSRRVRPLLQRSAVEGRVLGRFRRAIDLWIGGEVVALVLPDIGDGPFNVVVPYLPARALPRRFTVHTDGDGCQIGPWRLRLDPSPRLWEARPPWDQLAPTATALRVLQAVVSEAASRMEDALSLGLAQESLDEGASALDEALRLQDPAAIRGAAARLAGLGPGLTPSGDDYLAGAMLGLWSIAHGHARELDTEYVLVSSFAFCREACDEIYRAAASRTHHISRAFLKAARDGLADAHWHALLRALTDGEPLAVERAAKTVLTFGATSGFDMLLGFLHTHERL